jgi:hypothetical protein
MIESIAHERKWESAEEWLNDYKGQFLVPKTPNK